jgi:hypothetical protein
MLTAVDQVADDAHRLVVHTAVFGAQQLNQRRQRVLLHDHILVLLVLERQRPKSTAKACS